ncbi:MAG: exopolysaccharide biosynthesis polyprenyl glycosylphosphotransferase [Acidobacteria bacterium]|nr:MAG: exopolysaccharide biosynthesis polyprenyl glycosylphosphotransferase [Acidobacteriota bacterium]
MSAHLPYRPRLRTALAVADAGAMGIAAWAAHLVRFQPGERIAKLEQLLSSPGFLLWALASGWLLATAAELYEAEVLHRRREVILRVLAAVVAWSMALILATYANPSWAFGRGLLILTSAVWALLLVAVRWLFASQQRRRRWRFPALVVGEPAAVRRFCDELASRLSAPWRPIDGAAVALEDIPAEIARSGASIVILAGGRDGRDEIVPALNALHFSGVPVVAASEIWAWLEERLPLEALSPDLFLHQPGFGAVHWTLFNRLTRVADVVLSLLILLASSPLLLVAAASVLLADGRPVLYRQTRVGQYGRRFTMLKLRTMRRDAEDRGPVFAAADDPRVIPLGGLWRRFRIDELPQLWNVLRGEMSLVGPRPERPEFVAELAARLPYYSFRLAVPPGLTGWAQVNVPYASSLEEHRRKLEFDLYFIRERSLRLYLLTLLRTVSTSLAGVRRRARAATPAAPARGSAGGPAGLKDRRALP